MQLNIVILFLSVCFSNSIYSSTDSLKKNDDILDKSRIFYPPEETYDPYETAFQIELGGGLYAFFGKVSVSFRRHLSNFVPGFSLSYFQYDDNKQLTVIRKIEGQSNYEFRNQSRFLPYIGLGAGFSDWQQKEDEKVYDNLSSPLAFLVAGLEIKIGKVFSFILEQKMTYFTNRAPYSTPPGNADKPMKEEYLEQATSYKFVVRF